MKRVLVSAFQCFWFLSLLEGRGGTQKTTARKSSRQPAGRNLIRRHPEPSIPIPSQHPDARSFFIIRLIKWTKLRRFRDLVIAVAAEPHSRNIFLPIRVIHTEVLIIIVIISIIIRVPG